MENLEKEQTEDIFGKKAMNYIEQIKTPKFNSSQLKLARTDKEISKCIQIQERALHKKKLLENTKNKKSELAKKNSKRDSKRNNNFDFANKSRKPDFSKKSNKFRSNKRNK